MSLIGRRAAVLFISLLLLSSCHLGQVEAGDDVRDDDFHKTNFDPIVVILFMFFGLCVGIIVMQLLSRFKTSIPYTVVIFIIGALFSSVIKAHDTGTFGESVKAWANIDAELMLFIFLPPLIFGEAMSLNWHHILGALNQSLLLAGPGVLIGAAIVGIITKFMLPYNWGWDISMVFGSILSATDPVAVVALLKSAGASPRMTMLIVGESLLNDGTAMVLFTLFFKILEGESMGAGDIISFFFSACLGSTAFGIAAGLLIVWWLRSANRPLKEEDVTVQIAITLCSGYLIFFAAQYTMEISGVLACCGAGAMISWLGPPIIVSRESMHNVWGIIEWLANTLIFLLAGLIIGQRSFAHVFAIDLLYSFLFFLILMGTRVLIIVVLFPWLKVTVNEAMFISWAGLRGALAMALALIVENSTSKNVDHSEASRLFFYVGMIAALTLIFNATFAQTVLNRLKLIDDNAIEKELVIEQIRKRLGRKMNKIMDHMVADLKPEEAEEIRMSCSLLRESFSPSMNLYNPNADDRESYFDKIEAGTGGKDDNKATRNSLNVAPNSNNNIKSNSTSDLFEDSILGDISTRGDKNNPLHSDGDSFSRKSFGNRDSTDRKSVNSPNRQSRNSLGGGTYRRRSKSFADPLMDERLNNVSRLLSMAHRGKNSVVIPDLLAYIRGVFLEIVRVKYWQNIESGKLPRQSHSAQYLLYSVDVGIDEVRKDKLQDWVVLESHIKEMPGYLKVLNYIDQVFPNWKWIAYQLGKLESRREKRIVYILTSFIEAHTHAQSKIHEFLGFDDEDDYDPTPEETQVKLESEDAVVTAKNLLAKLQQATVQAIQMKQISRTVLAKQAELIKNMVEEGLLTPKHAEEFLEEIREDTTTIERERRLMYQQTAADSAKKRLAKKFDFGSMVGMPAAASADSSPLLESRRGEE